MIIEDGKGSGGGNVGTAENRALVSSRQAERIMYSSRDDGLAYSAVYDSMTVAAGDICAYLKNTSSTRNLFISDTTFGGVEAIKWKVFTCTGTAAAGESVTPVELNISKSFTAEATAMAGDTTITGLTAVAQVGCFRSAALSSFDNNWHNALILGPGDAIYVEYDAGTTGLCEGEIFFHYETI